VHEIALTRRSVIADDRVLPAAVRLSVRRLLLAPAHRQKVMVNFLTAGLYAAVARPDGSPRAERLAIGLGVGLLVAATLVALRWWRFRREARLIAEPELTTGAVGQSGSIPGYYRIRGPEDDVIFSIPPQVPLELKGPLTVLVRSAELGETLAIARDLLPPEDIDVLRRPSTSHLLPVRAEGDAVPLGREYLADGRWSRRAARDVVRHTHRSVEFWAGRAVIAVASVAALSVLSGRRLTPFGWAVLPTIVFLVACAWTTWSKWSRSHRIEGGTPGLGVLWSTGFGPSAYRIATPEYDAVVGYDFLESASLHRDVVRLAPRAGGALLLPRELVGDRDLERMQDYLRARAGAQATG
jgi:hypothetical protein